METTTLWDPTENLRTEEDLAAYLSSALEESDPELIAAALCDIARAKCMPQILEASLGRYGLDKDLSPDRNPEFSTILKLVGALGLTLHAVPTKLKPFSVS